jgi:hypothetical protein
MLQKLRFLSIYYIYARALYGTMRESISVYSFSLLWIAYMYVYDVFFSFFKGKLSHCDVTMTSLSSRPRGHVWTLATTYQVTGIWYLPSLLLEVSCCWKPPRTRSHVGGLVRGADAGRQRRWRCVVKHCTLMRDVVSKPTRLLPCRWSWSEPWRV